MINSAPLLPYCKLVPIAALQLAKALSPWVKSASKLAALRPVSAGHVVFVGSQEVKVWARVVGGTARAAAAVEALVKRISLVLF